MKGEVWQYSAATDDSCTYERAREAAMAGKYQTAAELYSGLLGDNLASTRQALVRNDLSAVLAVGGDLNNARQMLREALTCEPTCVAARRNWATLEARSESQPGCRVAILSFLFNWPSTSGGIVHTAELARFLSRAGYHVRHFYARYDPWGIGQVKGKHVDESDEIRFADSDWSAIAIRRRFRTAVAAFDPDFVIITDAWNFKPHLAESVRDYPYILRQQALECLCPLNNLCLLVDESGLTRQCPLNQLETQNKCMKCLAQRGHQSGSLHQAERSLSGVGTDEYDSLLRRALRNAEAVLVLNPTIAKRLRPYCKDVRVVTWGMDAARFPWPRTEPEAPPAGRVTLFMAGVVDEYIKGYHVLHEACKRLWQKRQDFELVVTGKPAGPVDEFTRFVGWLSQDELPRQLRAADIVMMPTIAQEGLGRTTVEAMAVGRPVIASRIGGLPYTVVDGVTGLLARPGDPADLAAKIERLLDDPELRTRMGLAGRERFDRDFTWDVVIERDYRPLLSPHRTRKGELHRVR